MMANLGKSENGSPLLYCPSKFSLITPLANQKFVVSNQAIKAGKMEEDEEVGRWWPVKLKLLQANYEKSKLQVRQNSLCCKLSIIQLQNAVDEEKLITQKYEKKAVAERLLAAEEQVAKYAEEKEHISQKSEDVLKKSEDEWKKKTAELVKKIEHLENECKNFSETLEKQKIDKDVQVVISPDVQGTDGNNIGGKSKKCPVEKSKNVGFPPSHEALHGKTCNITKKSVKSDSSFEAFMQKSDQKENFIGSSSEQHDDQQLEDCSEIETSFLKETEKILNGCRRRSARNRKALSDVGCSHVFLENIVPGRRTRSKSEKAIVVDSLLSFPGKKKRQRRVTFSSELEIRRFDEDKEQEEIKQLDTRGKVVSTGYIDESKPCNVPGVVDSSFIESDVFSLDTESRPVFQGGCSKDEIPTEDDVKDVKKKSRKRAGGKLTDDGFSNANRKAKVEQSQNAQQGEMERNLSMVNHVCLPVCPGNPGMDYECTGKKGLVELERTDGRNIQKSGSVRMVSVDDESPSEKNVYHEHKMNDEYTEKKSGRKRSWKDNYTSDNPEQGGETEVKFRPKVGTKRRSTAGCDILISEAIEKKDECLKNKVKITSEEQNEVEDTQEYKGEENSDSVVKVTTSFAETGRKSEMEGYDRKKRPRRGLRQLVSDSGDIQPCTRLERKFAHDSICKQHDNVEKGAKTENIANAITVTGVQPTKEKDKDKKVPITRSKRVQNGGTSKRKDEKNAKTSKGGEKNANLQGETSGERKTMTGNDKRVTKEKPLCCEIAVDKEAQTAKRMRKSRSRKSKEDAMAINERAEKKVDERKETDEGNHARESGGINKVVLPSNQDSLESETKNDKVERPGNVAKKSTQKRKRKTPVAANGQPSLKEPSTRSGLLGEEKRVTRSTRSGRRMPRINEEIENEEEPRVDNVKEVQQIDANERRISRENKLVGDVIDGEVKPKKEIQTRQRGKKRSEPDEIEMEGGKPQVRGRKGRTSKNVTQEKKALVRTDLSQHEQMSLTEDPKDKDSVEETKPVKRKMKKKAEMANGKTRGGKEDGVDGSKEISKKESNGKKAKGQNNESQKNDEVVNGETRDENYEDEVKGTRPSKRNVKRKVKVFNVEKTKCEQEDEVNEIKELSRRKSDEKKPKEQNNGENNVAVFNGEARDEGNGEKGKRKIIRQRRTRTTATRVNDETQVNIREEKLNVVEQTSKNGDETGILPPSDKESASNETKPESEHLDNNDEKENRTKRKVTEILPRVSGEREGGTKQRDENVAKEKSVEIAEETGKTANRTVTKPGKRSRETKESVSSINNDVTSGNEKSSKETSSRFPRSSQQSNDFIGQGALVAAVSSETKENPSKPAKKKRKTLLNNKDNSVVMSMTSGLFQETVPLNNSRSNAGMPPLLSRFIKAFVVPKLKK